jgi:hypothetical protein
LPKTRFGASDRPPDWQPRRAPLPGKGDTVGLSLPVETVFYNIRYGFASIRVAKNYSPTPAFFLEGCRFRFVPRGVAFLRLSCCPEVAQS